MNINFAKSYAFISISAFLVLNLQNGKKTTVISFLALLCILLVFIVKSNGEGFFKAVYFSNSIYPVIALLICICFGSNFYDTLSRSGRYSRFFELSGLSARQITLLITVLLVLAAVPAVTVLIADFSRTVINDYKKTPVSADVRGIPAPKAFCWITLIFLAGTSAIIRANYNYLDDMGRVLEGYLGWDNYSRFTSNGLSRLIHMDNSLTDISPFTQFIAILLLALTGIVLLCVIYEKNKFSVWEMIAIVPLGLNPYFLECISYKFDAPFMALSILSAVAPLLLRNHQLWKYILASAIGTVLVCTTYQASTGIFPMTVVLLALRMWFKKKPWKEIFCFVSTSAAGFASGLIFFKLFIMNPVSTYVTNTLPPSGELLFSLLSNYTRYLNQILYDFKNIWKLICVLLMIAFGLSGLKKSLHRKWEAVGMTAAAEILMLLLCFGLYPALKTPLFEPRAMYGFGVFIALLGVCTAEDMQPVVLKVPIAVMAWIFFVFSFTYGNALSVQKSYTEFRIAQVINDLSEMEVFLGGEPITVQISGTAGSAPAVRRMKSECHILTRLIPITFGGSWQWGGYGFFGYYDLKNVKQDSSVDLNSYDLPMIKDSIYHSIYGEGNYVLVKLKVKYE